MYMKAFKLGFFSLAVACMYVMPIAAESFSNVAEAKVNIYVMSHDEEKTLQKFALGTDGRKKVDLMTHAKEGVLVIVKQARSSACCLDHDEELEDQVTRGRCLTCGDSECSTRSTKCNCNGVNLRLAAKDMHPDNEFIVSNGERGKLKIKLVRKK